MKSTNAFAIYKTSQAFENDISLLPASQGLSSLFDVFLPFLQKASTSLLQGHVRAARLHHNRDRHEHGSEIPEELGSCACLWPSFASPRLVLHEQG